MGDKVNQIWTDSKWLTEQVITAIKDNNDINGLKKGHLSRIEILEKPQQHRK